MLYNTLPYYNGIVITVRICNMQCVHQNTNRTTHTIPLGQNNYEACVSEPSLFKPKGRIEYMANQQALPPTAPVKAYIKRH